MVPDRTRAEEPVRERETAHVSESKTNDPVSTILSGGNQMMVRLLESGSSEGNPGGDLAARIRAQLGAGSALSPQVRGQMEAGLGQRLGDVRVHTDSTAASLSTQLNAHAFTTGNDVFFNSGVYKPGTPAGDETLAHELTHTLQQASGPVAGTEVSPGLSVSDPHDHDEQHARASAQQVVTQRDTGGSIAPAPSGHSHDHVAVQQLSIQRHSSWEHTMMGNASPAELGKAVATPETRKHVLADLWDQMMFFSTSPDGDPRGKFPDIRWIQFKTSGLWASNGELNALADYLPDPAAADTMPKEQLVPVLQKMRGGIRAAAGAEFGLNSNSMEGAAWNPLEIVSEAAGEVKALDQATAGLDKNRYAGLLSRNACHFAPFSWHRWEEYHNDAIKEAEAHFRSRSTAAPIKDVGKDTEEHARQAILKNGYGDHFLQDSFASGHLINKTLVMQWWVDYLNQATLTIPGTNIQIIRRGQPDQDVMRRMASGTQTGIAGRSLYHDQPDGTKSDLEDRGSGTGVTDPQSAQERQDREGRVQGSGVTGANPAEREANYQAYLRLLNNAQAQGAAGATHDYFNAMGLMVESADGSAQIRVGGDDTLLKSGVASESGTAAAATAASLSRKAIDETLETGTTSTTVDKIFAMVPTKVVVIGMPQAVPLEQWQDDFLHDLCFNTIFPEYYEGLNSAVIGAVGSEMVKGGISQDSN
jgi:hypothetical protein